MRSTYAAITACVLVLAVDRGFAFTIEDSARAAGCQPNPCGPGLRVDAYCIQQDPGRAQAAYGLASTTIQYWIDRASVPQELCPRPAGDCMDAAALDDIRAAIRLAAEVWEEVKDLAEQVRFVEAAQPVQPSSIDDTVLISWSGAGRLGATFSCYKTNPPEEIFAGPDIMLATGAACGIGSLGLLNLEWRTSPWFGKWPGRVYLPAVLAHEFGHVLGLGHSDVKGALMQDGNTCGLAFGGDTFSRWKRTLKGKRDDETGLRYLYGINKAPMIESLTPTSAVVGPGETIMMTVSASDPEGDPLTYRWLGMNPKGRLQTIQGCKNLNVCNWQAPSTPGSYAVVVAVGDKPQTIGVRTRRPYVPRSVPVVVTGPAPALEGALQASESGAGSSFVSQGLRARNTTVTGVAPFTVDLAATLTAPADGKINYTFYCDRADVGTDVAPGWATRFTKSTEPSQTARGVCTYSTPGTYTAKVIIEQGTALPAQAQAVITVASPDGGWGCCTGLEGSAIPWFGECAAEWQASPEGLDQISSIGCTDRGGTWQAGRCADPLCGAAAGCCLSEVGGFGFFGNIGIDFANACTTGFVPGRCPDEVACGDGVDNDGDGDADCGDEDCAAYVNCAGTCTNECSSATRCLGDGITEQSCSDYNGDGCVEWGGDQVCPNGCIGDACG